MTDWPQRHLNLAAYVSGWSKDPSTKVGAVIFRGDGSVVSLGYNGFPRGVADVGLEDRERRLMLTIHAEDNAILAAGRNGTPIVGAEIAATHHPCARCAAKIVQSGIKRVWFTSSEDFETRWHEELKAARSILTQAGVEWRRHD